MILLDTHIWGNWILFGRNALKFNLREVAKA
jgi:hypothetical protein